MEGNKTEGNKTEGSKTMEEKVLEAYEILKELSLAEENPTVSRNARRALASVWQIVNNLGLEFEQIYEYE